MTTLSEIVQRALESGSHEYVELTEAVRDLLRSEQGHVGNLDIEGRLVRSPPRGEAVIVGDLHGDLESLVHILRASGFAEKAAHKGVTAVFLGDYGDRGTFSPEVYYTALELKQVFPENVVLMRGNHEGPNDLQPFPHDLPQNFLGRFAEEGNDVYAKIRSLYPHLYIAMVVEEFSVLLHGGIPKDACSLRDLAFAHSTHPNTTILEEVLWNDPEDNLKGVRPSPRGAGCLFGQDVTQRFLEAHNVNVLIRGHEPTEEGFKINHRGRVLTLFSRKGAPYFNNRAAYLQLDLSSKPRNAEALMPYLHQF